MANEDKAYSAWIRRQPCLRCGDHPPSEQHHKTGAGVGLRSHDHDSMPLCSNCHRALHHGAMLKDARRRFEDRAIETMRKRYEIDCLMGEPGWDRVFIRNEEDVF